jgi:hypothetical protein
MMGDLRRGEYVTCWYYKQRRMEVFLLYFIYTMLATINSISKPILFADDRSIIITHRELVYLENIMMSLPT